MQFEHRLVSLLLLLAVLGAPALGLRLLCAGHSCDEPVRSRATIPFCSLRSDLRELVAAGFREGRSPGVLAVASRPVKGGTFFGRKGRQPEWPSLTAGRSARVPVAFQGPDIGTGGGGATPGEGALPAGTGLDDIAPTLAALMGIERPHPEVRSGRAIPAASPAGGSFSYVLEIVWKGIGSGELEAQPDSWPNLRAAVEQLGTMDGSTRSLPLDPSAVLSTIGTGGTPSQHGITGSLIRGDDGGLTKAWSNEAPVSVIAALGDDLDETTEQKAQIALVASDETDRGLIGGNWYVRSDNDEVLIAPRPRDAVESVERLIEDGFTAKGAPALLAVTLDGDIAAMDAATGRIITALGQAVGGDDLAVVMTATGSSAPKDALPASRVTRQVERSISADDEVVAASVPGGLYLDQQVIAKQEISDDEILAGLRRVKDGAGRPVFEDVFPAIAVSFGRYC